MEPAGSNKKLLVELKKLQRQRNDGPQFESKTAFNVWADTVLGLLAVNADDHRGFKYLVSHVNFLFDNDGEQTIANVNSAIGRLNQIILALENKRPETHAEDNAKQGKKSGIQADPERTNTERKAILPWFQRPIGYVALTVLAGCAVTAICTNAPSAWIYFWR